jgi:hypothetical protein
VTILEAMDDPELFGPWFKGPTWDPWRAWLAAIFGLPLTGRALAIYQRQTGRTAPPANAVREAWLIVGRRGGKSRIAALIAVYLAAFRDYRTHLVPGERAVVMVLGADRRQARVILSYVKAFLAEIPMLADLIEAETVETVTLTTGISIEVHTASFRTTRGPTILAALCDEIAFWYSTEDSANPDSEITAALRPGMATIPNALLLGLSSPYAKRGVLFEAYRKHYGKDDSDVLVWSADTATMNPSVDPAVIEAAYEDDPASAASEYGRHGSIAFRSDVEGYLSDEVLATVVVKDRFELSPQEEFSYRAFLDPSGGSSDSFTMAIAHRARGVTGEAYRIVVDAIRERRPPFSPEDVVAEFVDLMKSFRISSCVGDRYAGLWVPEAFARHGIRYEPSERTKSQLYRDFLPLVNSKRVELLADPRLRAQLVRLERRIARGGGESIDHPAGGEHDDVSNAVAGVCAGFSARMTSAEAGLEFLTRQVEMKHAMERHGFNYHDVDDRCEYRERKAAGTLPAPAPVN